MYLGATIAIPSIGILLYDNYQLSKALSIIYGVAIAIGLIVYFFLIYLIGYIHVTELRAFNFVIQFAGIYLALKQFKRTHQDHLNFLRGTSIGIATSMIGSILFTLFVFAYLMLDPNLMNLIKENAPLGAYLDPYIASFSILTEGLISGSLATFAIINYIETDKD